MLIRDAEVEPGSRADIRVRGGRIVDVARGLTVASGERVFEAEGGALVPGLHDHHIHLFAWAAARNSVRCGPPEVRTSDELGSALRRAAAGRPGAPGARGAPSESGGRAGPRAASSAPRWIRGVGYHESVAGSLDREQLDCWLPDVPVRIQHRSGAQWILNSAALSALGLWPCTSARSQARLDEGGKHALERDDDGVLTGRLYRADGWLRERLRALGLEAPCPPELGSVGRELAGCGVTGVTDATPSNGEAELAHMTRAIASGALPQRLLVMGGPQLPEPARCVASGHEMRIERGPLKWLLSEHSLPPFDEWVDTIRRAHADDRAVAVHCVTRAELAFAIGVLEAAGSNGRDRIEHAAVAPPDLLEALARLDVTIVTQPNFVRERGDSYLRDVDPTDQPWLYRCAGPQSAGVPVGGGTDAPFGNPDPWAAMRAAVDRRTEAGVVLAEAEKLSPESALALFTSDAHAPGGPPRRIEPGAPADLCVLSEPWSRARDQLDRDAVRATLCGGKWIWQWNRESQLAR